MATPITGEPTPPASASLVVQADSWPVDVAVAPYAGTAHIFDGLTTSGLIDRYLGVVVAPNTVHARAAISRCWVGDPIGNIGGTYHELWSTDGGTTGVDIIRVTTPRSGSIGFLALEDFQYGLADIAVSDDGITDSPSLNLDRQIELQTQSAPYVEAMMISSAAGFSVCITDQVADLETL